MIKEKIVTIFKNVNVLIGSLKVDIPSLFKKVLKRKGSLNLLTLPSSLFSNLCSGPVSFHNLQQN